MALIRFLAILFDRIFLVIGVLLGAQVPLFLHQYIQRLSGHVAELNRFVSNLQSLARESSRSLDQYIAKFQSNIDPDFARHGDFMLQIVKRQDSMNEALQSLLKSPTWQRLYYFFRDLQTEIAEKTLSDFQPGINLTLESLGYMALGGILCFCIYQGIIQVLRIIFRFLRKIKIPLKW